MKETGKILLSVRIFLCYGLVWVLANKTAQERNLRVNRLEPEECYTGSYSHGETEVDDKINTFLTVEKLIDF